MTVSNALFSALAFALLVLTNYKSQVELEKTQRHLDETLKTNADIASTQKKSTAIQVLEMMAEAKAQEIAVHRHFANFELPLKADPLHMPYEHRHNFAMAKAQQLDAIATTSALIFAGNADPIRSIQEMQLRHLLADAVLMRVVYHDRPIDQVLPIGLRMWLIRSQSLARKLGVALVIPSGQPPMTDDPPNIISDLSLGCVTIIASVRVHLRDRYGVEFSADEVT